jgi:phage host-nuclease inhibitor protein Gam
MLGRRMVRKMAMPEAEVMRVLDQEIEEETQDKRFVVDSVDKLDWCVRQISEIEEEELPYIECAQRQIARLQQFVRKAEERIEERTAFFKALMRPFVEQMLADSKRRTINAPSGLVSLRKQEPEFEKDDDKLIAWLEENGKREFVKVKKQTDWAGFKKQLVDVMEDGTVVTVDGELIPVEAIRATKRPDKLYVKPVV